MESGVLYFVGLGKNKMKAEDHLKKVNEIKASIDVLKGDETHVIAVVELAYGLAQHLIAYGLDNKYGERIHITVLPRY